MEKRKGMVSTIFISCTEIHMSPTIFILYALLLCFHFPLCFAKDTLTPNDSISDQRGETLISNGKRFQLGFFRIRSSPRPRRYLGIWYYGSNPKTIVWVSNRENALFDDSGVFAIAEDGNLEVSDGKKRLYWSTKLEGLVSFKRTVKLLDSGNLVLSKEDGRNGSLSVIWQSFKNPTDTFLPGMEMNEQLKLISWKSSNNPASGKFKFQLDEDRRNQYIISKERSPVYWKSGVSGKFIDSDVPSVISSMLSNVTGSSFNINFKKLFRKYPNNRNITIPSISDKSNMRLVMKFTGKVQYFIQTNESSPWVLIWSEPKDRCSVFKACGSFESCNIKRGSLCKCLPGFETESQGNWNPGESLDRCARKTPLCSQDFKIGNWWNLKVLKVGKPDDPFEATSENECREECLRSCSCQAYAYDESSPSRDRTGNSTCWIWSDSLNNIEEDADGGRVIHLRVNPTVPAQVNDINKDGGSRDRTTQWTLIVAVTITSVSVLACTIAGIYILKKKKERKEDRASTLAIRYYHSQMHVRDLIDSSEFKEKDKKGIDLPFFDFESILAATDSFSEANKLGKGGFGPVYKGTFPGGQEIAVKRLSSVSGQGLGEFKNEVVLIARLQHRNLVRLLGYCIEGIEKILLYEYMPNKSLDFFIFDRTLRILLDWDMRFNIILGTARGLLYLHQDSRLRIIHRDLKTSNILLDQEMNPKISDFGLARIFEGKQTEGTTNRVVGTYGYISPEYALDGFFSVKSDVFSFGVVVLEIISGKRNTGFYNSEKSLSLLGHAWKFWQEDKALDIMELQLSASAKTNEILKCINVGLLCVQEDPNDRPTMSNVVVMLSSETVTLPTPKQPAFVLRRGLSSSASSSSRPETNTKLTITLDGR